jgi:putative colanic acid biosynthesis acetyltransferase WcaF
MRLDRYNTGSFERGRSAAVEALWLVTQALFVRSQLPGSFHRRVLLRAFGARIGVGVVIKPGVRVKFPWRLSLGDHAWLGEDVWIDNLSYVSIGAHACVSQGAYLCTGNHDWTSETFALATAPIAVAAHAWIAAKAVVAPGVTIGEGTVLALGSSATANLEAWHIYAGNPAVRVCARRSKRRFTVEAARCD